MLRLLVVLCTSGRNRGGGGGSILHVVSSGLLGVCEEGCLRDCCGGTIHSLTVVQIVVGACVGCLRVVRFVCVRHGTWCETNMFSNPVEEHTLSSYHHAVLLAYRIFSFSFLFFFWGLLCVGLD